jgi:hypothetical protein
MDEKILNRVTKLLALANDKGATEHEAALALEKAYAILAEHNLTMDAVQGKGGHAGEKREEQQTSTNWSENYYLDIWNAVAQLNACFFQYWRPNPKKRETKMYVFGRESNVVMTTTMADYLCQTMRRLSREAAKEAGRKDYAFTNTYLMGMGSRLVDRVNELRHAARAGTAKGSETGTNLPALAGFYDNEYNENYKAKYGIDLNEERAKRHAERAANPVTTAAPIPAPAKPETEEERAKRLKEQARAQREYEARCERERAKQRKQEAYLREGGGYSKGYRDAENVSLLRQVDQKDAPSADTKKLK